jgi:ribosome recycling factor
MVKDSLNNAEAKMKKTIDALRSHLGSIRTGRASPRWWNICMWNITAPICR